MQNGLEFRVTESTSTQWMCTFTVCEFGKLLQSHFGDQKSKPESGTAAAVNRKCAVKLKLREIKKIVFKRKKESYTQSGKGLRPVSATAKP